MRRTHASAALVLILACALPALAALAADQIPANATALAPGNATAARPGRVLPVAVEHAGSDRLGQRLALELKERLNVSTLFALSAKDEPKLKLALRTVEEFPGRPGLGSAVSLTWIYSAGPGLLTYYLDGMAAVTDADNVAALVQAIVARTDGVAGSYAYLFEK